MLFPMMHKATKEYNPTKNPPTTFAKQLKQLKTMHKCKAK